MWSGVPLGISASAANYFWGEAESGRYTPLHGVESLE